MSDRMNLKPSWIVTTGVVTVTLAGVFYSNFDNSASAGSNTLFSQSKVSTQTIAQAQPVRIGAAAPQFTGTDSNGKTHRLSDFKGKTVVLEWTNHDCPFVRKHYNSGNMQRLQKEARGKGVVWLSIVSSATGQQGHVNGQRANQLTQSRNASPTAVILDPNGTIGRLYSARTTPHMYIIDAGGILRYMGAIDDKLTADPADIKTANNYVRTALNSVLSGQSVRTATTQPYGCSVKYGS